MLASPFSNFLKVPGTLSFCFDLAKPHFRVISKRLRPKICVPGTLLEPEIGCQAPCFWVQDTVCCRRMRPTPSDVLIVRNGVSAEIEADLLAIETKKAAENPRSPAAFACYFVHLRDTPKARTRYSSFFPLAGSCICIWAMSLFQSVLLAICLVPLIGQVTMKKWLFQDLHSPQ